MTRLEFDRAFLPMVKSLNVKINSVQADYFWAEFGKADPQDFAHACRELAMGNPGYLPKLDLFREYVASAKEMRVVGEKVKRDAQAKRWMKEPPTTGHPLEDRFAKCCHAIFTKGHDTASAFVAQQLEDEAFRQWLTSWNTEAGQSAIDWMEGQLEARGGHLPRLCATGRNVGPMA